MANPGRLAFRAWYYLRIGYATYLALTLAGVNSLVTVYYLAIKSVPSLQGVFPDFTSWAIVMASTTVPFAIFVGWLHLKRSRAYSSEIEVSYEANPFLYKLPPGYTKEVMYPLYLEILRLNIKILNKETLTEEERKRIVKLEKKLENLISGGFEGWQGGRLPPGSPKVIRKEIETTGTDSTIL